MKKNTLTLALLIGSFFAVNAQIRPHVEKDLPAGLPIRPLKESGHSLLAPRDAEDYQWRTFPSVTADNVTEASIAGDGPVLVVFYRKPRPELNIDEGIVEKWTGSQWANVAHATNECHYPDIDVKGSVVVTTWNDDGYDYGYGTNVNGNWVSMTGSLLYKQWYPRATMAMGLPYMSFTCKYSDGMPYSYDMLHIRSLVGIGDRIELNGGWSVTYTSVGSKTDITGDDDAWYTVFSQQQYVYVKKGSIVNDIKQYEELGAGFRMYNPVSNPEIVLFQGIPIVAWLENGNTELYVAGWNGAEWMVLGSASLASDMFYSVRMAASSTELFVVTTSSDADYGLSVNSFDGDQWYTLPVVQNYQGSNIGTADIAVHNEIPVVAFTENNKLVVKSYSYSPTAAENAPEPASHLQCYPNPTTGMLELEVPESGQYLIEVSSLTGKLIYSENMQGRKSTLDLSAFPEGIYFVTVRNDRYIETRKVIKR